MKCSWWGSNPRPIAHKTIALTTELQELVILYHITIPLSYNHIYNKVQKQCLFALHNTCHGYVRRYFNECNE